MFFNEFIFDDSCDDLFCKEFDVYLRLVICDCSDDVCVWRLVIDDFIVVSWDWRLKMFDFFVEFKKEIFRERILSFVFN